MRLEHLLYPQLILLLWGPLAVLGVWRLARPVLRRLHPRHRFGVDVALAVTPALALFVPYDAESPLRTLLPWRVPLAWGWGTTAGTSSLLAQLVLGLGPAFVLGCLAVSFALGLRHAVSAWWTLRRLPGFPARVLVVPDARLEPGSAACTVGLLRPVVVLSEAVDHAVGAPAVREHELAHARGRHALWILVATCALRAFWWVPGKRALVADLRLAAELSADDTARTAVGAAGVARALRAQVERLTDARPAAGGRVGASSPAFLDPCVEIEERSRALAAPTRPVGRLGDLAVAALTLLAVVALTVLV